MTILWAKRRPPRPNSRPSTGRAHPANERGAVAVELALLAPVVVLLLTALIFGGRLWLARSAVTDAAAGAARAATLARTGSEAQQLGQSAASKNLSTQGLACSPSSVALDLGAFATPVGQPARVTARVRCTVPMGDLVLPGIPGSVQIEASASSALDTYRGRR